MRFSQLVLYRREEIKLEKKSSYSCIAGKYNVATNKRRNGNRTECNGTVRRRALLSSCPVLPDLVSSRLISLERVRTKFESGEGESLLARSPVALA